MLSPKPLHAARNELAWITSYVATMARRERKGIFDYLRRPASGALEGAGEFLELLINASPTSKG